MVECGPDDVPETFLRALTQGRCAIFLGAGCSAEAPAELPTAAGLAQQLVEKGAGHPGESLEDIAERLWRDGGWQEFARSLPLDDWRARPCNRSHEVVAELCKEGLVRSILTTNWDVLIESALAQVRQPYSLVLRANSLATEALDSVTVIKLHGCINHADLMRATRTHVENTDWIDEWARALFENVLRMHSLLFVGYSGASRAATATAARIASVEGRTMSDTVVDKNSYESMLGGDYEREFHRGPSSSERQIRGVCGWRLLQRTQ